jgi:hypothetical protein
MEFYNHLPLWLSSLLVLGVTVAISVGAHIGVRALIPKKAGALSTELATALIGAVSAFIGIMLAFAAVEVWQDYGSADQAVAQEAAASAELYRDLTVYGDETKIARVSLQRYVTSVLHDEWPRLAVGESSPVTAATLVQLFRDIGAIHPAPGRDTVIYGEIFKKLNEVVGYRRARLITSRADLPMVFWLVVLTGSAVIVAFTFVYPATKTNLLFVAGLALSLGLIFLFILTVAHPFAGAYAVDNQELRDLLPLFQRISASP